LDFVQFADDFALSGRLRLSLFWRLSLDADLHFGFSRAIRDTMDDVAAVLLS
jgi:hypothetical protein